MSDVQRERKSELGREVAALELIDIYKGFTVGGHRIEPLRGACVSVRRGAYLSIVGPSGSGKSTLLHILGCLERPDRGRVIVDGTDIHDLDDSALARFRGRTLGFVFQRFHLLDRMSALRNVELPLTYREDLTPAQCRDRAIQALKQVGLEQHADHRPRQLSGGQQQRVAIARALAAQPRILLLDEPTGNLDPETGREVMHLIHQLRRRNSDTAVILVTHDHNLAREAPERFVLGDGVLTPISPTARPCLESAVNEETGPRTCGSLAVESVAAPLRDLHRGAEALSVDRPVAVRSSGDGMGSSQSSFEAIGAARVLSLSGWGSS
ncbi:MAG: ABC transporter ATP-binding protein [Thioalkalivibrionaceae bacterium]